MSETPPPPSEDPGSTPPPPPSGGQPYGGQPVGPPYGQPPGPPYGQPPYGAQPYGGPPYGAAPANNQKALWSMILGILGLVCCGFFAGIPALILGKQAQHEIDASGGTQGGRGMATAGYVMGIIACVLGVLIIVLYAVGLATFNFSTSP